MMWNVLLLFEGKGRVSTLQNLASVHARDWQCEVTLHAYFKLIDAVPSAKKNVVAFLETIDSYGPAIDIPIIDILLAELEPEKQVCKTVEDYSRWMTMLRAAKPTIESILCRVHATYTDNKQ